MLIRSLEDQELTMKMPLFRMYMAVVFLFLLGFAINSKGDPNYIDHICSNFTTFPQNSTYQSNLNLLLSSFSSNSTNNNGFYKDIVGQDLDTVYGVFLCRGDLSTDVCQDCVTFATQDVVQRCPIEIDAIIWYDECHLHYSNPSLNYILSDGSSIALYNTQNATNVTSFDDLVQSTMTDIAAQASSNIRKFATGARNISSFNTLYTLAQCNQDLSSTVCQGCLLVGIGKLLSGAIGASVLSSNCFVRYETYLFYNQSFVLGLLSPLSPPSPPPSPLSLLPPASRKGNF